MAMAAREPATHRGRRSASMNQRHTEAAGHPLGAGKVRECVLRASGAVGDVPHSLVQQCKGPGLARPTRPSLLSPAHA